MLMLGYKELYEAREQLDARGKRPNGRSWGEYLSDIGLAYRSDLVPNGTRLTCDIPLSKRYQIATQTHEEALQSIL